MKTKKNKDRQEKSYGNIVLSAIIIITIQVLVVALLSFFVYFNVLGIRDYVLNKDNIYIIFILLLVMVIGNIFFISRYSKKLIKVKSKTDLASAELLGNGIDEAYTQGKLGLIVVDRDRDHYVIIWANTFLLNRYTGLGKTLINSDITEVFPGISTSIDEEFHISDERYYYKVKYFADSGLFIFIDETDNRDLRNKYDNEALVIGTIRIDNYRNDYRLRGNISTLSEIKRVIALYFQKYQVSITQTQEDSFELIFSNESLQDLINDQFSILDEVKKVDKENLTNLVTISIGVATGIPNVPKLQEMCNEALREALARGGDQAVISVFGKNLKFIGGRTLSKSSANNANTRSDADDILSTIEGSEEIFIMGHKNTDLDAFGSAVGVYAMCKYKNKNARVVFDKALSNEDVKNFVLSDFGLNSEVLISPKDALKIAKERTNVLLIIVDVSSRDMVISPELLDVYKIHILVIDHHQPGADTRRIENPMFSFINPTASSASEMVANYIKYATANPKIKVEPRFATAMLAGILLDTDNYVRDTTTPATYEASMFLRENGADNQKAAKLLVGGKEEFMLLNKYLSQMRIVSPGIAYVLVDEGDEPVKDELLSKIADNLARIRDIKASFVLGLVGQRNKTLVKISSRSDGTINVGKFMQMLGGGGRFNAAAGVWSDVSLKEKEKELLKVINESIDLCKSNIKEEK